jgi:predicted transcriptional regulator
VARSDSGARPARRGLGALRRGAAVSDLLFLYECTTREVAQLRSVAEALGLTVQAASHTFRGLARRGLVELVNGRYHPTVLGVDYLHGRLDDLESDLARRLERLHIVRTTRAVARSSVAAGAKVVLTLEDGLLTARMRGPGPARGVAVTSARPGGLVEVERLEGIVPLAPGPVTVVTLSEEDLKDPALSRRLVRSVRPRRGLLAALGLEASTVLRSAGLGPVERFAIADVARDASRMGVPVTIAVAERELPRLLASFAEGAGPPISIGGLPRLPGGRRGRGVREGRSSRG